MSVARLVHISGAGSVVEFRVYRAMYIVMNCHFLVFFNLVQSLLDD